MDTAMNHAQVALPRITIEFCARCRWMLRASYYAQELLSTFEKTVGEVALRPGPKGVFMITIEHCITDKVPNQSTTNPDVEIFTIWDRERDKGFPETTILKQRVRDIIEPDRNLGHVDRQIIDKGTAGLTESTGSAEESGANGGNGRLSIARMPVTQLRGIANECDDCNTEHESHPLALMDSHAESAPLQ